MGILTKISWKVQVHLDARAALAALCEQFSPDLYRYALSITGHREYAQDAVQEVFLALSTNLKLLKAMDQPRNYLFRAVRYQTLRLEKRVDRHWEELQGQELLESPSLALPERVALQQALAKLPSEQREVLILKEMFQWSFREIADHLEISLNTAASRHRYGLAKLRQELHPLPEVVEHD